MNDGTHECPAPGCVTRVRREQLACPPHWYAIPADLRERLWRAWRRGTDAEHAEARAACVAALRESGSKV